LDFTWGYSGNTTQIMIRGKYGSYPANIADNLTQPSDGYLVYYGANTTASDTSMDFDQNPGAIYYRAWGQKNDGTWDTSPDSGWKESAIMTLIGLFLFAGILTFVGARSSYSFLKFLAGGSWLLLMAYWVASPPSTITAGDSTHTIGIILFIGMALAMFFMPMWSTKTINGNEVGVFNIRIPRVLGGRSEEEESESRRLGSRTWRDRRDAYQGRLSNTSRGRR